MGYRSSVAIALYGNPKQVDMVDTLLLQKLDPQYYRDLWEEQKQVKDPCPDTRMIVWTFDDIKWYSDLDGYREDLFRWVEGINEEDTAAKLCVEYARIGETTDDAEEKYSQYADCLLRVVRMIELPNNFEWRD